MDRWRPWRQPLKPRSDLARLYKTRLLKHFSIGGGMALILTACVPGGVEPDRAVARSPDHTAYPANPTAFPRDPAPRPGLHLDTDLVGMVEREPVWAAKPVVANAISVPGSFYFVQAGETLGGIGNRTGAGPDVIAHANGLTPPYVLRTGQRLTIPAGRYHRVAEGETGIAIALAYDIEWRRVVALNGLQEPFALRRGQRLLLPPGTPARPASTLEARAAAFRIDIDDVLTGGQPAAVEGKPIAAAPRRARPIADTMPIAQPSAFSGSFAWPLSGAVLSRFGPGASGQRNNGVDIAAPRGTPIHAAAGGVVAYAGDRVGQFGGLVLLTHGSGWVTAYAHAGRVDVVRGQRVEKGQVIGISGDTGYTEKPQLHFEIRKDRIPINPLAQLPAR
ncbi:hypothetical protein BH10PSE12_BH10PSE12_04800 [soil metagenome]